MVCPRRIVWAFTNIYLIEIILLSLPSRFGRRRGEHRHDARRPSIPKRLCIFADTRPAPTRTLAAKIAAFTTARHALGILDKLRAESAGSQGRVHLADHGRDILAHHLVGDKY